jgi:hypothetical protein
MSKLQNSTLLFNSRRPAQLSLVEVVLNPSPISPTNAQRLIQDVFENLRKSTYLFKSHRQSPSSLSVLGQPLNPRLPQTDISDGVGNDVKSVPTPRCPQSIIRHVFQELGKQRSFVIPSISPQRPSIASLSQPANPDPPIDSPPSSSRSPPDLHSTSVPMPVKGIIARVKGWFMQARYSPNHIPDHQRRVNFLEDE